MQNIQNHQLVATVFINSYDISINEIYQSFDQSLKLENSTLLSNFEANDQVEPELDLSSQGQVYEGVFIKEMYDSDSIDKSTEEFFEVFIRGLNEKFTELRATSEVKYDVTFQNFKTYQKRKLAVFDMDSTLIQQEVIDELARIMGVGEQVSHITESAMRGEIDFETSLALRLQLLSDAPVSIIGEVQKVIEITPGAKLLCKALKSLGMKLAVISGGFLPLANFVKEVLNLDYAYANQLETNHDGTKLTGKSFGPIVTAERKRDILAQLASENHITNSQSISVGDGANDLLMLGSADLGIAFNAKPKVQLQAFARINRPSLLNVLFFLGLRNSDIVSLVKEN